MVNAYHKVSFHGIDMEVPHVPLREFVTICVIPDRKRDLIEFRFWWNKKLVHTVVLSKTLFPSVHF
ncbi:hypothetical protein CO051_02410 [Candidatus Roizmanbacteria bacterium CG_4_9_14_0_2_um_filter_39_13]|uniref:Uncharacterized protein n=2 Tax=Candidatus Roizmaniibacteriota TaxID=1752723 RepID=A0A2M8F0N7_9BACT|nr:MAG: hypothetical protein COY15_04275 [Candidatus Roizmanbacteria bacterium CG_4_10_14_0_2_um_filter_39_12]PJC32848.1 MAG: hypothetical protein CO051_02410 [Candidatus Roizmanbacteria bacterium CG_4_9_14_0_2_um_filter_39_13]PJE62226.1 MAG: hypothetical protein COU87_00435 [Candidatus Roizmanbacteria bacterium CG10_big_fil_rev_8_21_14_0_10_39_12]